MPKKRIRTRNLYTSSERAIAAEIKTLKDKQKTARKRWLELDIKINELKLILNLKYIERLKKQPWKVIRYQK